MSLMFRGEVWIGNTYQGIKSMWLIFKVVKLGKIYEGMNIEIKKRERKMKLFKQWIFKYKNENLE